MLEQEAGMGEEGASVCDACRVFAERAVSSMRLVKYESGFDERWPTSSVNVDINGGARVWSGPKAPLKPTFWAGARGRAHQRSSF